MNPCTVGQVCPVRLDELGDQFRRYRLRLPQAVQAMAQSLRRWGQCADRGDVAGRETAGARWLYPLGGRWAGPWNDNPVGTAD